MRGRWRTAVLAAGVLAACGGCRGRGGRTELKLAHIYEPLAGPVHEEAYAFLRELAAEFEAEHPDVRLRLEQVQWDKIDRKLMSDYAAGVGHDVAMTSPQLMPQHAATGDLLDLAPMVSRWPQEVVDDLAWTASWRQSEQSGQRLGIPTGVHARVVIYRRDYFLEAGLDPDAPPRDLAALLAAARALTRDTNGDGEPDVWGLGLYLGPSRATIELYFAPLLWHFGGDLWDPATGRAVFASDAGVQAALFLADCLHGQRVTPPWAAGEKYDDVILQAFLDGKLAMAWGWGSYWNRILEERGWARGIVPPRPDGGSDKVGVFVTPTAAGQQFANAWTLSIHALSRQPELALALIEKWMEPQALDRFVDAGLPARRSAWARPQYQTAWYKEWYRACEAGRPMPGTPHYNHLADSVAAALQEIVLQRADAAATLARYQEEFNGRYAPGAGR